MVKEKRVVAPRRRDGSPVNALSLRRIVIHSCDRLLLRGADATTYGTYSSAICIRGRREGAMHHLLMGHIAPFSQEFTNMRDTLSLTGP